MNIQALLARRGYEIEILSRDLSYVDIKRFYVVGKKPWSSG
jgi:hypothetical protein